MSQQPRFRSFYAMERAVNAAIAVPAGNAFGLIENVCTVNPGLDIVLEVNAGDEFRCHIHRGLTGFPRAGVVVKGARLPEPGERLFESFEMPLPGQLQWKRRS
jgi:hypothetical protein